MRTNQPQHRSAYYSQIASDIINEQPRRPVGKYPLPKDAAECLICGEMLHHFTRAHAAGHGTTKEAMIEAGMVRFLRPGK